MNIQEAAEHIANEIAMGRDGSYSFNYEEPKTGYFVGGRSWTLVGHHDVVDPYVIRDYLTSHRTLLSHEGVFVGWWTNDGKVYVDISEHHYSRSQAVFVAESRSEIAVWDIENSNEIFV